MTQPQVVDHRKSERNAVTQRATALLRRRAAALGGVAFAATPSVAALTGGPGSSSRSTVVAVPRQPPGFGSVVAWDEADKELAVVGFLSAADELGLGVTGVQDGDTIQFYDAEGTATFDVEKENEYVGSLITIVAAGAGLGAAVFGSPELAPLITAAGDRISKQFPKSEHPGKPRDPYGMIPDTHEFARQEGGILICSPSVQGIYYSANDDHQSLWIQSSSNRNDSARPDYMTDAFFLQRGMGPRTLSGSGELNLCAWDYSFRDNSGFYRVNFILRRAEATPPVELRREAQQHSGDGKSRRNETVHVWTSDHRTR